MVRAVAFRNRDEILSGDSLGQLQVGYSSETLADAQKLNFNAKLFSWLAFDCMPLLFFCTHLLLFRSLNIALGMDSAVD